MPLLNVTVKNFKQENIIPSSTTTITEIGSVDIAGSNTLAKSALITLTPSSNNENPSGGGEGYWAFGTNDLTISGNPGAAQGKWLTYGNPYYPSTQGQNDAYWTTAGNPLMSTEFDPGGGGDSVSNFNSSSPTLSMVNGAWTTINQTYDHLIGHDFWKYNLQGNYLGENYEPTSDEPLTYYKVWTANETTGAYSDYSWYDEYSTKWSVGIVDKVVAVNSMPLIPIAGGDYWGAASSLNLQAQQGNKIFVIVILKEGITGQDILDLGGTISIDLDGLPTFIDFEVPTPPSADWSTGTQLFDTNQEEWFDINNSSNSDENADVPDGVDADDGVSVGVVSEAINISFSDSEETDESTSWGNSGLTEGQYLEDEAHNQTSYDSLASASANSVDEDFN